MEKEAAWRSTSPTAIDWAALHDPDLRLGHVLTHGLLVPMAIAACAIVAQYSPLDFAIATFASDPATHTFPWRESAWLEVLGHHGARALPILVGVLAAVAGVAGFAIERLRPWRRILLTTAAAMALGPLSIAVLKTMTTLHCPTDMREFGGILNYAVDQATPFWAAHRREAGRCLPSEHAGGGYALLALYFAGWCAGRPAWRWSGLAIGVVAGVLFSVVRVLQGAHFTSATLWSAAVDWEVCALCFLPLLLRLPAPRA